MDMRIIAWAILPPLILLTFKLGAQSEQLRKADKQFDYHAYSSALAGYKELDRKNPGSGWVDGRIGACLVRLNQPLEALPFLRSASSKKDAPPDHLRYLANAYRSVGKYQEARSCYLRLSVFDSVWSRHFINVCDWAMHPRQPREDWIVEEMDSWNSKATDFGVTPFGAGFLFSSFRSSIPSPPPGWVSGQTMHYIYQVNAKETSGPALLKRELGFVPNEGPCAIDSSSGRVVFMRANFHGNHQMTSEAGFSSTLFVASLNAAGQWEHIRPFEHNGSGFSNAWPSFSRDGKRLYFSSDKPGGLGGFDLYVSHWNGKGWGEPEHLGPKVNTRGDEITPWEWEGNLFFASDWHPGYGGFDLFIAYLSEDGFFAVSNLGKPRNSSFDDLGPIMLASGDGFLVSNRKGRGDMDIYRCKEDGKFLRFAVRDAVSGVPLQGVTTSWGENPEIQLCSSEEGVMVVPLTGMMPGKLFLRKSGYIDQQVDLRLARVNEGIYLSSLWPSAWEFQPSVNDIVTGNPISGAALQLTEKKNGFVQDLITDQQGRAKVKLKPLTPYALRVSCTGCQEMSQEFTTGATPEETFGRFSLRMEVHASSPKPIQSRREVYAIQLGAIRKTGSLDLSFFQKAEEYGVLFTDTVSTFIKVRLGYFATRHEADSISSLLEKKGFVDRLLVTVVRTSPLENQVQTDTFSREGPFRLRLAALRDDSRFDPTAWTAHGKVLREKVGDFTVISVAGIADLESARRLLDKASHSGFPDAIIQLKGPDGLHTVH